MLSNQIFDIKDNDAFEYISLQVFKYQAVNNSIYSEYLKHLNIPISSVNTIADIPFLPVRFFKTHKIISGDHVPQKKFTSSGTTGMSTSSHYVTDIQIYEKSFVKCFEQFYGLVNEYAILALLPSYLEREGSSLIYMVEHFIQLSDNEYSGFYLNEFDKLAHQLEILNKKHQKTLLIGVSFALLDFAEKYKLDLSNVIVMETGGMKGRRKEIVREELHQYLKNQLNIKSVHSEYGMTELLSQAYSKGEGKYFCPSWMKVLVRDVNDPFSYISKGKTGGINIIDLANINSCSFLETNDLGKIHNNGSFEILGRFDDSDLRGCNLLVM